MTHAADEVVVTGLGVATAGGYGREAHWQLVKDGLLRDDADAYSMREFKAAPYLSDRRMLKAVSPADAIGLAAVEGAAKDCAFAPGLYADERIGLYVGAPPASTFDNEPYMDALAAARGDDGRVSVREFGRTCMSSRPTTLLLGLPNNVLCYGAMILNARGPNSNYTSSDVSAHLALSNAAKRLQRGQLDMAMAGGFSAHTEPMNSRMYADLGLVRRHGPVRPFAAAGTPSGTVLADGGAFAALERRDAARARGARILATYCGSALASDALGPLLMDERGAAYEDAVRRALATARVAVGDVGLVFASASGIDPLDRAELAVLTRLFGGERVGPALGHSTGVLGNLGEAAGVLELGLLPALTAAGELPPAMRALAAPSAVFGHRLSPAKPYVLILRASPWGHYSCVVARRELQ